jgi:cytochrome c peroxidase
MSVPTTAWNGLNVRGEVLDRRTPMFWDNRTLALEGQAARPSTTSMRCVALKFDEAQTARIVRRLSETPEYVAMFEAAFGSPVVTELAIVRAIAAFERTLVARGSSFDRFMLGDETAMSFAQQRG